MSENGFSDARRHAELRLMEHLTALLLWCERLQAHPTYPGLVKRYVALPSYLQRGTKFALACRASLFGGELASRQIAQVEADIMRLKVMLSSLRGLEGGLQGREQAPLPSQEVRHVN